LFHELQIIFVWYSAIVRAFGVDIRTLFVCNVEFEETLPLIRRLKGQIG
jgi:hypothetical protein